MRFLREKTVRDFQQNGRSTVMSTQGMAATSHPASTQAAIDMLKAGGSAIDSAIAACAVQCVVEPGSTGIGGDCFALYSEKGMAPITAFNGAGWAPQHVDVAQLTASGQKFVPRQSADAVTVPGAVDAWSQLHARFGQLPWKELFAPAIALARNGYAVAPRAAKDWQMQAALIGATAEGQDILLINGAAPQPGDMHRQPQLADTLELIAHEGCQAFYAGDIAKHLVDYLRSKGGAHKLEDFTQYQGEFVTPVQIDYRGYQVHECPPPGQGMVALVLLNILKQQALHPDPQSADRLRTEIEATRIAYKVRDAILADPRFNDLDLEYVLSDAFAMRVSRGDLASAIAQAQPGGGVEHKDTVYISVVDKNRNCASFINSIFHPFGTGWVEPHTGILLHNRGQSFSLEAGHPNCIGPHKRPMHTIIPGMVTKNGRVEYVFGVMGGHYQAMGHAHFLTKVLDYGMDVQAASDLPRLFPLPGQDGVECEHTLAADVQVELQNMGYRLENPAQAAIGGCQAIRVDWERGVLHGASDHRKDGCALGY